MRFIFGLINYFFTLKSIYNTYFWIYLIFFTFMSKNSVYKWKY